MNNMIPKTEDEWKKTLTPEQYRVLREKGTERPFTGALLSSKERGMYPVRNRARARAPEGPLGRTVSNGVYACAACGNQLFSSDTKFDSGTGWPSFDRAIPGSVRQIPDASASMTRVEVVCAKCGGHLGHVFEDGPTATCKRFCINSVALQHKKM